MTIQVQALLSSIMSLKRVYMDQKRMYTYEVVRIEDCYLA